MAPACTWEYALAQFDTHQRAAGTAASTRKLRQYQLRRAKQWMGKPLADIDRNDLAEYMSHAEWSLETRRSARSALRAFFDWCLYADLRTDNPAHWLPRVRAHQGKPRPASDTAVATGLRWSDKRTELMIHLAARVGLRCCEIARVHKRDLYQGFKGWMLRVHGKGDKIRDLPLPDDLAATLRSLDGYAFEGQIDGHLSAKRVSELISDALPVGVTAHMLRHRYATRALRASGNLIVVQRLLGHASVATTQIYTDVDDDALWEAALAAA